MSEPVAIVDYDPAWPLRFLEVGTGLRQALGQLAHRIDHIGSTSVRGLAAKPIVDVQVSIASLAGLVPVKDALAGAGWVHRARNPDLTKAYFREAPGARRTHIHVRAEGSWSEQLALLFRDYLREHDEDASRYAAAKRALADVHGSDRVAYTEAKGPVIWEIMARASAWSQGIGWRPGASDA